MVGYELQGCGWGRMVQDFGSCREAKWKIGHYRRKMDEIIHFNGIFCIEMNKYSSIFFNEICELQQKMKFSELAHEQNWK